MVVRPSPCDPNRVRSLLEAQTLDRPQAVEAHLETCEACQRQLETLAAGDNLWADVRRCLGPDADHGNPPTTGAVADGESQRDVEENEDADWLLGFPDFLGPSDNPAMLGHLGTYEIAGVIGRGGMGIVLKGFDAELNRYVAIKVLAPQLATSAAARQRFRREALAAAAVVHGHVLAIHTVVTSAALPYLVMPYVAGESLQQRIDRAGVLELKEILRIGMQVAEGLAAAHARAGPP